MRRVSPAGGGVLLGAEAPFQKGLAQGGRPLGAARHRRAARVAILQRPSLSSRSWRLGRSRGDRACFTGIGAPPGGEAGQPGKLPLRGQQGACGLFLETLGGPLRLPAEKARCRHGGAGRAGAGTGACRLGRDRSNLGQGCRAGLIQAQGGAGFGAAGGHTPARGESSVSRFTAYVVAEQLEMPLQVGVFQGWRRARKRWPARPAWHRRWEQDSGSTISSGFVRRLTTGPVRAPEGRTCWRRSKGAGGACWASQAGACRAG